MQGPKKTQTFRQVGNMTPGTVSAHVPSGHSFVVENSWFESQLLLEGGWPECGCLCSHFSAHWNLSACILLLRILGQAYLGKRMMTEVGEPLGGLQAVQRQVWDHLALDFISDSPAGVGSVIAELRMNCKAVLFETPLHVVSLLCACGPTDIGQAWPYSPVYVLESGVCGLAWDWCSSIT